MIDPRFYTASPPLTLQEIEQKLGLPLRYIDTQPDTLIYGISSFEDQIPGTATYKVDAQFKGNVCPSPATLCILKPNAMLDNHPFKALLMTDAPKHTFGSLARLFYPDIDEAEIQGAPHSTWPHAQIDKTALIHPDVEMGPRCRIGPYVTIAKGVRLGSNCTIHSHVSISHAILGNNVVIHTGARIGQPGFGFAMDEAKPVDLPHLGRVIIEDDVRIGSNTTIDRGFLKDTHIGQGSRIDNLVQIAHNVIIGKGCVLVSQVGIAGSTQIGDFTILAGQVGIADHLKIGKNVIVAAKSGVTKSVPDQAVLGGTPAVPIGEWRRQSVILSQLARGKK